MNRAIGVFGLSGVGKSTVVKRVVSESGRLARSVNAGELIRRRRGEVEGGRNLRLLTAEEILSNQELLVAEFAEERSKGEAPVLLLDGHCVVDNGERLVTVPPYVIEQLYLSALVFIQASPEAIAKRRSDDGRRARPCHSNTTLRDQQEAGLSACTSYAIRLGLPLAVVTVDHAAIFVSLVKHLASSHTRELALR